jgi:hypothetical protein
MDNPWMLQCRTCGKTGPFPGVRIGAVSVGKSMLVACSGCGKLRWARVCRADQLPSPSSDGDDLWHELLAYVSEGTLSVEHAEALVNTGADPARVREAAAHVAEGRLGIDGALRLLTLPGGSSPAASPSGTPRAPA